MFNKKSILTLLVLFTAGFVPIQLVTLSFAYSQYYMGETLGPKMVITAHDFALPYFLYILIPSIIVFVGIMFYSRKHFPDLFRRMKVGIIAGIMLTLALDVVRQNGVINGWLPQDVPMLFGKMVTGSQNFNTIFLVGLLIHTLNGINFGILYTFLFGKLKSYKASIFAGMLLLFVMEIGMMTGPPMAKMVGPFGVNWAWPQLFLLTLAAHLFSGIACGLTAQFLLKKEDKQWLLPFLLNKKLKNMKMGGINIRSYIDNQFEVQLSEMVLDNKEFILKIQKELLKGTPLTKQDYYQLSNLTKEKADEVLKKIGETDEQENIVAFSGLSVTPTNHRFIVNGKTLYTWCVVDAILFSEWLDVSSLILSNDPIDHSSVELKIERDHLEWSNPYPLFVSWVETMDCSNIRASFCNHVSFFASETTANQWLKDNPGGKILTIEEFFDYDKLGIKCC